MTRTLLMGALLLVSLPVAAQITAYKAKSTFDSAKEDLVLGIQGRGLVIDHTSYIGNMLERTGKDLGAKQLVFARAEALQFCSAVVSRRTMEANAAHIAYCPYVIALYTLPGEAGTVHVVYQRRLPEIDQLLDGIIRDALDVK